MCSKIAGEAFGLFAAFLVQVHLWKPAGDCLSDHVIQAMAESIHNMPERMRRRGVEEANHWEDRLRPHHTWPSGCRAAKQRNKLPTPH